MSESTSDKSTQDARSLIKELFGNQVVSFHPILARITDTITGLFLSQGLFWAHQNGYKEFQATQEDWEKSTTLSRAQQELARQKLRKLGILEERYARLDHKFFYKLSFDKVIEIASACIPECEKVAFGKPEKPHSNECEKVAFGIQKEQDIIEETIITPPASNLEPQNPYEGMDPISAMEKCHHENYKRFGLTTTWKPIRGEAAEKVELGVSIHGFDVYLKAFEQYLRENPGKAITTFIWKMAEGGNGKRRATFSMPSGEGRPNFGQEYRKPKREVVILEEFGKEWVADMKERRAKGLL